jgi:hypothetical protein
LDSSRVLVAVILSIVLVFAYQELVLKRFYPPQTEKQAEQAKAAKSAESANPGGAPAAGASVGMVAPGAVAT